MEFSDQEEKYERSEYTVDFGKDGCATVRVWDPCKTPEAKEKRRKELQRVCLSLIERGLA